MSADMDDILGASRIQDWIVDQYQWLDSEPEVDQQLQQSSLRESSLLPSDFDPFTLPTPELPVDEHEHLVQEMNAWKMPGSSRDKPLPPRPALKKTAHSHDSQRSATVAPVTRKRPSLPLLSTGTHAELTSHVLPSSPSHASLRSRRFPSVSTTASASASPAPPPQTPTTPASAFQTFLQTPALTHTSSSLSSTPSQIHLPSLVHQPSMPSLSLSSKPSTASLAPIASPRHKPTLLSVPQGETSRWSLASSTNLASPATITLDTPNTPGTPGKPKQKTFRTRLLSTISRLGSKRGPGYPPTPSTPATPSRVHVRQPSDASELGYISHASDVEDPFAAPPPPSSAATVQGDYAAFLARAHASSPDGDSAFDGETSYATSAFPYSLPPVPFSAPPTQPDMAEFGIVDDRAGEGDDTLGPARGEKDKKEERRKQRMSWASTRSASRARVPRKRLIVSGLDPLDGDYGNAQERAVRAWCQTFGEIRKFSRGSDNQSVLVDWKSAAVAENVCVLQARVHIQGAGSVALSWVEAKRKLF
ncbi:unnamed protein product [Peniophora sp. CBMAI 1063]|nr:unnamed protein product [Peniophora sp. CBMAI 1063]